MSEDGRPDRTRPPATTSGVRLFLIRGSALAIRPAAVLAEGALVADGYVLVLVLPLAAISLMLSAVPVHLDYFRGFDRLSPRSDEARRYASGFTTLTLGAAAALAVGLPFAGRADWVLALSVVAAYLVERLSTELSRTREFLRDWTGWFAFQLARSGWMFVPVAAALAGADYEIAFLVAAALAALAHVALFLRILRLYPRMDGAGFVAIAGNALYLMGSPLSVSYREGPRLVVGLFFPAWAHVYQAVSQIAQSATLVFTVRFQAPYWQQIARRTRLFQRRTAPAMRRIGLVIGGLALVYLVAVRAPEGASPATLALLLTPILLADAVGFGVLQTHLSYVTWTARPAAAARTFALCIGVAVLPVAILATPPVSGWVTPLALPAVAILLGQAWVAVILLRHFGRRAA